MCYHPMLVKTVAPTGSGKQYIPCGKCEECRNVTRSGWSFRLQSELSYRSSIGWHVGFCTLTYAPQYLPILDHDLIDEPNPQDIPCFSRVEVTDFIKAIRKYIHRHYRVKELVYMVCSEYGKKGRPHYHMLLSWPNAKCVDKSDLGNSEYLDSYMMHKIVRHCWKSGFVFPQYHQGGFDGFYYHKPFEVTNVVSFAAKYAAKYCCKDIQFARALSNVRMLDESAITDELRLKLRDSMPFHVQSRSLGWSLIRDMSDSQKLKILEEGYNFLGVDNFQNVPLYIRNKIFFTPDYIIDSAGKRLVRRKASEWFDRNYREVYERKVDYYQQLLQKCCTSDFWYSRGIDQDHSHIFADSIRQKVSDSHYSLRELSQQYVSWFGVWPQSSYAVDPVDAWYSRFKEVYKLPSGWHHDGMAIYNGFNVEDWPLNSVEFQNHVDSFWSFVFDTLVFTNNWIKYHEDDDAIQDHYKKYLDEQNGFMPVYTVERPLQVG